MKEKLIQAWIKHLKEYWYEWVDENNILTDMIYSSFFQSMLEWTLEEAPELSEVINDLLNSIKK